MNIDQEPRRDAAHEIKARRAHEARTAERRERTISAQAERREIEAEIRQRQSSIDALKRAPDHGPPDCELQVRKLEQEISYLGRALYLLRKSGRSGR